MNSELFKKGLTAVKMAASPVIFWTRKHAPEILVGTGAVSILGGTVLACRATIKSKEILDSSLSDHLVECIDGDDSYFVEEPRALEDLERKEAVKLGLCVVKEYAVPAGLVVGGVGMLVAAKSIEHRRLVAALASYSSLQSMFEQYRARIVEENGEDVDRKALTGTVKEEAVIFGEDGKKKGKKVQLDVRCDEDPFHRVFDDCNAPHNWRDNIEENEFFLKSQEVALNIRLKRTGRVFLNEVYEAIGFDYLPIGQFVGWVSDDIEGSKDGKISFGIDYAYMREEMIRAQHEGRNPEPSLWLNFNCDGEVWNNPMKKRYDV